VQLLVHSTLAFDFFAFFLPPSEAKEEKESSVRANTPKNIFFILERFYVIRIAFVQTGVPVSGG
jgi:hypothetical protein